MNYSFFIKEFAIITSVYFLGELLTVTTGIPLPGNVVGMLLMVLFILSGLIKIKQVEKASSMLLDNLALFFIPITVGLITYNNLLTLELISILFITVLSTITVLIVTGKAVQCLILKQNQRDT